LSLNYSVYRAELKGLTYDTAGKLFRVYICSLVVLKLQTEKPLQLSIKPQKLTLLS